MKYSAENSSVAPSSAAAPLHGEASSLASVACSSEPAPSMASAAAVGLKSRLVQRLEVRIAPTAPSIAATRLAAAGPSISSTRMMKISPAAYECLVPGTRTGNIPAQIASAAPPAICIQTVHELPARLSTELVKASAPPSTTHHHKTVAGRL